MRSEGMVMDLPWGHQGTEISFYGKLLLCIW